MMGTLMWVLIFCSAARAEKWAVPVFNDAYAKIERGEYAAAIELYGKLAKLAGERRDTRAEAYALHGLAYGYHEWGQFAEAARHYRRALTVAKAGAPETNELQLRLLNNLAAMYMAWGRYADADRTIRQIPVVPVDLSAFPAEEALYHNSAANILLVRGKLDEAEASVRRALIRAENRLGGNNRYVAGLLSSLANVTLKKGNLREAVPLFERVIAMCEATTGPNHPLLGRALSNLAHVYAKARDFRSAEAAARRAITILERTVGPKHLTTGEALLARARALRELKRGGEAKPLEKRGRAILAALNRGSDSVVDISTLRNEPARASFAGSAGEPIIVDEFDITRPQVI